MLKRKLILLATTFVALVVVGAPSAHPDFRLPRWGAEKAVRYYYSDAKVRNVRCKGIWADGAHRVKRTWYFTHFWCEARFSDGWWTFKLHALKRKTPYPTQETNWRCGRLRRPCAGGSTSSDKSSTAVRSCGWYAGVRLTVEGDVSCSTARSVYHTYAIGGNPGWQCSGTPARGQCYASTFSIGDKVIRWSR
jgi:hypothetical protein